MTNPTKSEKLKWTRKAANRIARGKFLFSCCDIGNAFTRPREWYSSIVKHHSGFWNPFAGNAKQERLMWLCFLITLIEHGEPEWTDL